MGGNALESSIKTEARRAFLALCSHKTRRLHDPVCDLYAACGHPNPAGLGDAARFSQMGSWGQSSVLFPTLETYRAQTNVAKHLMEERNMGFLRHPKPMRCVVKLRSFIKAMAL